MFYPGSSIGNFTPAEALAILRQARQAAQGGGLLIGVDLVKPLSVLEPAYDDALGVTAAFNRNLLRHINHLLGSDFDVAQWQHRARFNVQDARIEMHLGALQEPDGVLARGTAPLWRRRVHPHRKLLQIHPVAV